jgi:hypothetical protein
VFVFVVVAGSPRPDDKAPLPLLALCVTDLAGISSDAFHRAAQEVPMIYRGAGVRTVWAGPSSKPSMRVDAEVAIILLSETIAEGQVAELGLRHDDLGYAIRPALRAYILWPRIRDVELQFSRDAGEVLGLVIAHEVGHLLLPDDDHSPLGIMRSEIDLRSRHRPYFTRPQVERIHERLAGRDRRNDECGFSESIYGEESALEALSSRHAGKQLPDLRASI